MKSIRSADEKVLAELLREWRLQADLNQEELASKLGHERRWVLRVESGDQIPNALECRRWAKACKKTAKKLWWHLEFRLDRLTR